MRASSIALACFLAAMLATHTGAQDPEPGSVLVYPSVRELGASTVVSITNVHPTTPATLLFSYHGVVPGPGGTPFIPDDCIVDLAVEFLSPNDTLTVNVACHNPSSPIDGYLVVNSIDSSGLAISHNYLIGSQFVAQGASATYSLAATSFQSLAPDGFPTDLDGGEDLDFDGLEYTMCPETLLIDTFLASVGNRLALINMTGGAPYVVTTSFSIFNDNEFPFQWTQQFRCWFDRPLDLISPTFSLAFLLGTPHNPAELDADCDGFGDLETGWATVVGNEADDGMGGIIDHPALLGAITGTTLGFERGRPLWRQGDNPNGTIPQIPGKGHD